MTIYRVNLYGLIFPLGEYSTTTKA